MSHLVGVKVYQEYMWEYRGLRHLAIHGHQFDRFVLGNMPLSKFFTWRSICKSRSWIPGRSVLRLF